MPLFWLIMVVLAIALAGFVLGRSRALASAGGEIRGLHSLPNYYGWNVALMVMVPAFGLMVVWVIAQPLYVANSISATLPDNAIAEGSTRGLVMAEVRRTADALAAAGEVVVTEKGKVVSACTARGPIRIGLSAP